MTTPATALTMTREDAAFRSLARLHEHVRHVETGAASLWPEIISVQELFRELDPPVTLDVELSPGLAAGFSTWKQQQARKQGQEIARADADTWVVRG